jgi:hypothetical protein
VRTGGGSKCIVLESKGKCTKVEGIQTVYMCLNVPAWHT